MDPVTIAALVAGGASLLGTVTNNLAQRKAVKAQNEYNTPSAQMARYQSAGLSPNLIYGSGQASSGNQTSLGDYQGLKISTQDALNMANAILNFKNLDANTRKATAEAQSAEAQATNLNLDTQQKQTFLSQYHQQLQQELEYTRLRNLLIGGQISLQDYQRALQDAQVRQINSQIALNEFNLKTGLPLQLAISQQNANTAEQNMILANKRFAFDSSFDENVNPLNYWNSAIARRNYKWAPVKNSVNAASGVIGGVLGGAIGAFGRLGKAAKGAAIGAGSRGYTSYPDYGFYD